MTKKLHLNAFLMPVGHHEAAWRLPESDPVANLDIGHYIELARIAERGRFDSVFLADSPPVLFTNPPERRPSAKLEPTIVLTAIAAATSRIGLIGTASTSYNDPYNLARRFASLDYVSGGRAGWNIVTTAGGRRRPQLRPRRGARAQDPVPTRRRVRGGLDEAVGQLGGRRDRRGQGRGDPHRFVEGPSDPARG